MPSLPLQAFTADTLDDRDAAWQGAEAQEHFQAARQRRRVHGAGLRVRGPRLEFSAFCLFLTCILRIVLNSRSFQGWS